MTAEGWKLVVSNAIYRAEQGDDYALDLLAQLLEEVDDAKEQLRRLGFGCTGTPWSDVVKEVAERAV